jgi:hypothetical protein
MKARHLIAVLLLTACATVAYEGFPTPTLFVLNERWSEVQVSVDGLNYRIPTHAYRCIDLFMALPDGVTVREVVNGSQSGITPPLDSRMGQSWSLFLGNSNNLAVDLMSLQPSEPCRK